MSPAIKLGWAFFALIIVALIGYLLTRGTFIGTTVTTERLSDGQVYYARRCRYLYASGVRLTLSGGDSTAFEEAKVAGYCPLLSPSN